MVLPFPVMAFDAPTFISTEAAIDVNTGINTVSSHPVLFSALTVILAVLILSSVLFFVFRYIKRRRGEESRQDGTSSGLRPFTLLSDAARKKLYDIEKGIQDTRQRETRKEISTPRLLYGTGAPALDGLTTDKSKIVGEMDITDAFSEHGSRLISVVISPDEPLSPNGSDKGVRHPMVDEVRAGGIYFRTWLTLDTGYDSFSPRRKLPV